MPEDNEWIGMTEAAIILEVRYLKARDFMTQGLLGEVRKNEKGKFEVQKSAVTRYKEQMDG